MFPWWIYLSIFFKSNCNFVFILEYCFRNVIIFPIWEVEFFCYALLILYLPFNSPVSTLYYNFIRQLHAIIVVLTMGRKWLIEAAYWYNRAGCDTWQEHWNDGLQLILCKNIQPWNMHLRMAFCRCLQNADNLYSEEVCKLKIYLTS